MTQYDLLNEFESKVNVPNASLEQDGNILVVSDGEKTVHVVEIDEAEDVRNYIDVRPLGGGERFGLSPREAAEYVEGFF